MLSSHEANRWSRLANLPSVIQQLTEQPYISDIANILEHVQDLETKIAEQDTLIKANTDMVAQLKKEHKDRQKENAEIYAEKVQEKMDEKNRLEGLLESQTDQLKTANISAKNSEKEIAALQEKFSAQGEEVKKLYDDQSKIQSQLEHSQRTVEDRDKTITSMQQQLQAEREMSSKLRSDVDKSIKKCTDLEKSLGASNEQLEYIKKLAPPLAQEDCDREVTAAIRAIWEKCFNICYACFENDSPIEPLKDSTRWQGIRALDHETYVTPLVASNSPVAKRMRCMTMLAILARSLIRHLLCSTYLFGHADEMDRAMLEMPNVTQDQEAFLRRLLNSVTASTEEQLVKERIKNVTSEVTKCFEELLSAEQSEKMKSDLSEMLQRVADLWRSLQKRHSCFVVEPQKPSQTSGPWQSLVWDDKKKTFRSEKVAAPQDVMFILFPRILMLKEREQVIFTGVVLLRSETTAAYAEVIAPPPASSSAPSAGNNRHRRASTVMQNGLPRSVAQ